MDRYRIVDKMPEGCFKIWEGPLMPSIMVVSDYDLTLGKSDGEPHPENIQAFKLVNKNGGISKVSTGRTLDELLVDALADDVRLKARFWSVTNGGATFVRSRGEFQLIDIQPIESTTLFEILKVLGWVKQQHSLQYHLSTPRDFLLPDEDAWHTFLPRRSPEEHEWIKFCGDFQALAGQGYDSIVTKLCAVLDRKEVADELEMAFREMNISVCRTTPLKIELGSQLANKRKAILRLLEMLSREGINIMPRLIVTCGDQPNDAEILNHRVNPEDEPEMLFNAFCVANGLFKDHIEDPAKCRITLSNDEGGVAHAIRQVLAENSLFLF